ncbi:MAG TPA: tetratricopeptide repeat protein [Enterococcus sp.]|nr:tetratricopeptide repeat protein [Enterococcus sp.]
MSKLGVDDDKKKNFSVFSRISKSLGVDKKNDTTQEEEPTIDVNTTDEQQIDSISDNVVDLAEKQKQEKSQEGLKWLKAAADVGDTGAMNELAYCYLSGVGLTPDPIEGELWLRRSAELGDLWAIVDLAVRLLDGEGIEQNSFEGEKWLRLAVERRDAIATRVLGYRLLHGDGLQRNKEEGTRYLFIAAEELHELVAMRLLGIYLIKGDFLTKNVKQGEYWLKRAADGGEKVAMREWGRYLIRGL